MAIRDRNLNKAAKASYLISQHLKSVSNVLMDVHDRNSFIPYTRFRIKDKFDYWGKILLEETDGNCKNVT